MNFTQIFTIVRRDTNAAFRTPTQFLAAPMITAFLYIFIFGSVMGSRVGDIEGVPYIMFVFPGILSLNVIMAAFNGSAIRIYFSRFLHFIQEMLVSPISYTEMILGNLLSVFVRVLTIAAAISLIGFIFGAVTLSHMLFFVFWLFVTTCFFGLLGFLTGLWAESFEQLGAFPTFIVTPLAFLGGMFTSIHMLPEWMQIVSRFNPFFYVTNGFRYAMTGYTETNIMFGSVIMVVATVALFGLVVYLVSKGWKIRE